MPAPPSPSVCGSHKTAVNAASNPLTRRPAPTPTPAAHEGSTPSSTARSGPLRTADHRAPPRPSAVAAGASRAGACGAGGAGEGGAGAGGGACGVGAWGGDGPDGRSVAAAAGGAEAATEADPDAGGAGAPDGDVARSSQCGLPRASSTSVTAAAPARLSHDSESNTRVTPAGCPAARVSLRLLTWSVNR